MDWKVLMVLALSMLIVLSSVSILKKNEPVSLLPDGIVSDDPNITTFSDAELRNGQPTEFGPEDASALGVTLGDSSDVVISVLGEPERLETYFNRAIEETCQSYYYGNNEVSLSPYGVFIIKIESKGFSGPREIKVGDTRESVLAKFPREIGGDSDNENQDYLYGGMDTMSRAIMALDDDGEIKIIFFTYGGNRTHFSPVTLRVEFEEAHVSAISVYSAI